MSVASITRRGFLRGRLRPASSDVRPPWAVEPGHFEALCDRCGDCIRACPAGILVKGDAGFPKVDFSAGTGECTFCGDCERACAPGALQRAGDAAAWALRAAIDDRCLARQGVECRVCGERCPEGAIRFQPCLGGIARPETIADRCTGCGACFAPCPTRAIALEMHQ